MAVTTNTFTGLSQSVNETEVTPKAYVQPTSDTAQSSLSNVTEPATPKPQSEQEIIKVYTPTNQPSEEAIYRNINPDNNSNNSDQEVSSLSFQTTRTDLSAQPSVSFLFEKKPKVKTPSVIDVKPEENRSPFALAGVRGREKLFTQETTSPLTVQETAGVIGAIPEKLRSSIWKVEEGVDQAFTSTFLGFTVDIDKTLQGVTDLIKDPKVRQDTYSQTSEYVIANPEKAFGGLIFDFAPALMSGRAGRVARLNKQVDISNALANSDTTFSSIVNADKWRSPQVVTVLEQQKGLLPNGDVPSTVNLVESGFVLDQPVIRLVDPVKGGFKPELQTQLVPKDLDAVVSPTKVFTQGNPTDISFNNGFSRIEAPTFDVTPSPKRPVSIDPVKGTPNLPEFVKELNTRELLSSKQQSFIGELSQSPEAGFKAVFGDKTTKLNLLEGNLPKSSTTQLKFVDGQTLGSLDGGKLIIKDLKQPIPKTPKVTVQNQKIRSFVDPVSLGEALFSDPDILDFTRGAGQKIKENIGRISADVKIPEGLNADSSGRLAYLPLAPLSTSARLKIIDQRGNFAEADFILKQNTVSVLESKTLLDVDTITDTKVKSKIIQDVKVLPVLDTKTKSKTKTRVLLATGLVQEQRLVSDEVLVQDNIFEPKKTIKRVVPNNKPPKGFVPFTPRVRGNYEPLSNNFFVAEVKTRGSFLKYSNPLSYEGAYSKGIFGLVNTASASFRIRNVRTGELVRPSMSLGRGFRLSKVDDNVVVQKRGFRIGSAGEKREITYKGIFSSKKKKTKRFNLWE